MSENCASKDEFAELKNTVKEHESRLHEMDLKLNVIDNLIPRFIESTNKLEKTMNEINKTMVSMQFTIKEMSMSLENNSKEISSLKNEVSELKSSRNLDVVQFLKEHFIEFLLIIAIGGMLLKDMLNK